MIASAYGESPTQGLSPVVSVSMKALLGLIRLIGNRTAYSSGEYGNRWMSFRSKPRSSLVSKMT